MVEFEDFSFIETGTVNWATIKRNLKNLFDRVNDNTRAINAIAQRGTETVEFAIEARGNTVILESGKHPRLEIVNAWVLVGDDRKEEETIELDGISDLVHIGINEGKGKLRIFQLKHTGKKLNFIDQIMVRTSNDRRMLVGVTFQSTEVKEEI